MIRILYVCSYPIFRPYGGQILIYLDNAATARPYESAIKAAEEAIKNYGNPSSPHKAGKDGAYILKNARGQVASALGCKPESLIFTSGGTEANNLAILSLARKNRRAGNRIITDLTEHPSALSPLEVLTTEGFEIAYIPMTGGKADLDTLAEKAKGACLVSFMHANNQTGCLTDIKAIRETLDSVGSEALFHCDAVQAFCKTDAKIAALPVKYCDTASVSAHKLGGFKGCGALYHGERAKLLPLIRGGDQESGLRGGTENTVGIAAFGAACAENIAHPEYRARVAALRKRFIDGARSTLGDMIEFFIPPDYVENIINFAINGLKSEVCLNYLSSKGICISSSSACSVHAKKNTVLPAYGLPQSYTDCAVRVGFSHFNTDDEVDTLINELKNAAAFAVMKKGK